MPHLGEGAEFRVQVCKTVVTEYTTKLKTNQGFSERKLVYRAFWHAWLEAFCVVEDFKAKPVPYKSHVGPPLKTQKKVSGSFII